MPKYFLLEGYRVTLVAGQSFSYEFDIPRDMIVSNIFIYGVVTSNPTYFSLYSSSTASATIANMIYRNIFTASPGLVNYTSYILVQQGRLTAYWTNGSGVLDEMLRFCITCIELEANTKEISKSYPLRSQDQFSR